MSSRVAVLTPFAPASPRGNAVTVGRLTRGLIERDVDFRLWDLSAAPEAVIEAEVEVFQPALVHAFHAFRVGPLGLRLARIMEVPLVVTVTGTDVNEDLFDADRAATVRRVLEATSAIVAFHASIATRIGDALPDLAARITVIPQAARLDEERPFDLAARWALPARRVVLLLPSGIRPVKNPRFPLAPLDGIVTRRPEVRLLYVGPELDADEGAALREALAARPWARWIGPVAHADMRSLLRQADVVLNCSRSEGGMANAVLEALAAGRAVLASDIDGNRSLVEDGVTGLLFRNEAEFAHAAERLIIDSELRTRLGQNGRRLVERLYPPEREVDAYVRLYARLIMMPGAPVDTTGPVAEGLL